MRKGTGGSRAAPEDEAHRATASQAGAEPKPSPARRKSPVARDAPNSLPPKHAGDRCRRRARTAPAQPARRLVCLLLSGKFAACWKQNAVPGARIYSYINTHIHIYIFIFFSPTYVGFFPPFLVEASGAMTIWIAAFRFQTEALS